MGGFTRGGVRALVITIVWSLLAIGGGAPTAAAGPGIAAMATGAYHSCAVATNGTVWCWGLATHGQLGDGTTGDANRMRSSPVEVLRGSSALKSVTKVAAGAGSSCAVRSNGTVWCWGDASQGQLGNGQSGPGERQTRAVQVRRGSGYLTAVRQIAMSGNHVCALRSNGSVYCWGFAAYGQIGDGTVGEGVGHVRDTAARVRRGSGSLDEVVAIATGYRHSCATRKDGSVLCWGDGSTGQLGDGERGAGHQRTKAAKVKRGRGYLTRAAGIAAGGHHTCVRRTDRTAWCWGFAGRGQLGDGTTGDPTNHVRTKPVRVLRGSTALTGVTGIGAGMDHTCARRSDGSAWCWGMGLYGQLGDGTTGDPDNHVRLKPVRVRRSVSTFTGVRALGGGVYHTCALRTNRSVWCWGLNSNGQLGRGTNDDDPHPFPGRVTFP